MSEVIAFALENGIDRVILDDKQCRFEVGADLVLLDDYEAREKARLLGLKVTGTIGILLKAKKKGVIRFRGLWVIGLMGYRVEG